MDSVQRDIWQEPAFDFRYLKSAALKREANDPAPQIIETDTDTIGNLTSTATDLPLDGTVLTAGIQYTNDMDWFRVTSDTAQVIRVTMQTSARLNFNPAMYIFDVWGFSAGTMYQYPSQLGSLTVISVFMLEPGQVMYLQPFGFAVGSTYTVTASPVTDDQSAPVPLPTDGTPLAGRIDYEFDHDYFTLTIHENERIEFRAFPPGFPNNGSNFVLTLYGPGQTTYALNLVTDGASWVGVAQGIPAGNYQLALMYGGGYLTDYQITARAITDDHPNTLPAGTSLAGFGGSLSGAFEYFDDRDFIGISAPAAGSYRIDLRSVNGSYQNPALRIHDSAGTLLTVWGADTEVHSTAEHTLDTPGTFYVSLGTSVAAQWGYDTIGDWQLELTYLLSAGHDVFEASAHDDRIDGLGGNDKILGGLGDDFLNGGDGNDALAGGTGNDRLIGGVGADKLNGGAGRDVFVVGHDASIDTISDFQPTWDMIHIAAESGSASFAALQITQSGNDVIIALANGGSVRLTGMLAELIGPGHFVFLGAASAEMPATPDPDFADTKPEIFTLSDTDWHLA